MKPVRLIRLKTSTKRFRIGVTSSRGASGPIFAIDRAAPT
jgi:hypothetical protein